MKILAFLSFILLLQTVHPTAEYNLAEQDLISTAEVSQNVPLYPTRKTISKFSKHQLTTLVFKDLSAERLQAHSTTSASLYYPISQHLRTTPLYDEYSLPPPLLKS